MLQFAQLLQHLRFAFPALRPFQFAGRGDKKYLFSLVYAVQTHWQTIYLSTSLAMFPVKIGFPSRPFLDSLRVSLTAKPPILHCDRWESISDERIVAFVSAGEQHGQPGTVRLSGVQVACHSERRLQPRHAAQGRAGSDRRPRSCHVTCRGVRSTPGRPILVQDQQHDPNPFRAAKAGRQCVQRDGGDCGRPQRGHWGGGVAGRGGCWDVRAGYDGEGNHLLAGEGLRKNIRLTFRPVVYWRHCTLC